MTETNIVQLDFCESVTDFTYQLCMDFEKETWDSYRTKPLYFRKGQWANAKVAEWVTFFNSGSLFPYVSGAASMTPPDISVIESGKKNHDADMNILDKSGNVLAHIEVKSHPFDSKGSLSWVFKRSVANVPAKDNEWFLFGYYLVSGKFLARWFGKMKDLQELDCFTELDKPTDNMVCVREADLMKQYIEEVEPEESWIEHERMRLKLFEITKKRFQAEVERHKRYEEKEKRLRAQGKKVSNPYNKPDWG